MIAIWRKEVKSYFSGMSGYIIIAFLLAAVGFLFKYLNLQNGVPKFEYTLAQASILLLLFIPLLTMRSFSEERRQKTDLLLYSLPISLRQVILGKYFALLTIVAIPCAVMGLYPLILRLFGEVSLTNAYTALFAFFLLCAACIAIGLFLSTLTDNQMIAAMLTFAVLLCAYLMSVFADMISSASLINAICFAVLALLISLIAYVMTKNYLVSYILFAVLAVIIAALYLLKPEIFEGSFSAVLSALSLFDRMTYFFNEVFDLTAVFYYLSVSGIFLFLSVQSAEKRRWS